MLPRVMLHGFRFLTLTLTFWFQSGLSSVGANSPRPQSPPSPIAKSTTTTAITAAGGPRPGSPQGRCCDTGRPLFTDPLTGQTVCSCQYDLLSYQRLASAGVGPAGLPALSMYSAPYADGMAAYFPALGADQAPFYTPSVSSHFSFIHPWNWSHVSQPWQNIYLLHVDLRISFPIFNSHFC